MTLQNILSRPQESFIEAIRKKHARFIRDVKATSCPEKAIPLLDEGARFCGPKDRIDLCTIIMNEHNNPIVQNHAEEIINVTRDGLYAQKRAVAYKKQLKRQTDVKTSSYSYLAEMFLDAFEADPYSDMYLCDAIKNLFKAGRLEFLQDIFEILVENNGLNPQRPSHSYSLGYAILSQKILGRNNAAEALGEKHANISPLVPHVIQSRFDFTV